MLNHPNDHIGAEVLSFLSVFMYDGNKVVQVMLSLLYVHLVTCCKYGSSVWVCHLEISLKLNVTASGRQVQYVIPYGWKY